MHTSPFTFARCGVHVSQRPLTLALGLALGLGSAPLAGLAATISVFTANDAGSATDCTLRQAIVSMNTSSVSGTGCVNSGDAFGTGDTINFAPPDFPQFQARTITLADANTSTLAISDANLTITAGPYAHVTIERPAGAANDFRIMYDTAPDGGSPNNWVSSFGGPAWTLDPTTGQYYLHNFLPEQPDLNWWNDGVRDEFDRILRFWFERGISGGQFHESELENRRRQEHCESQELEGC